MAISRESSSIELDQFRSLQHRVRGVIGSARSKAYKRASVDRILNARINLTKIITEGRERLAPFQYQDFLEWSDQYTRVHAPAIQKARYHYDELGRLPKNSPLSVENEIAFSCSRLSLAAETINSFRLLADALEMAFWSGDADIMRTILSQIESSFGETLWLIEAQVAFKQLNEGLDAQKQFVQEVRTKSSRGIAQYFAHFISVKNEPTVTLSRFSDDIAARLNRTRISPSAKQYLNVRLGDNWPSSKSGFASILQVEQTTSIIDLYETFIRLAQRLLSTDTDPSVYNALRAGLAKLTSINDFRIAKLNLLLDPTSELPALPYADLKSTDLLLAGHFKASYRIASGLVLSNPLNINNLLTAALCIASPNRRGSQLPPTLRLVLNGLVTINAKQRDFDRATSDLLRLTRNFSFLPSLKALRQVVELDSFPRSVDCNRRLRLKVLNGRELDPRDFVNWFDVAERPLLSRLLPGPGSTLIGISELIGREPLQSMDTLHPQLGGAILAARISPNRTATATSELRSLITVAGVPPSLRIHLALLLLERLINQAEMGTAADLVASEFVAQPSVQRALPIADLVGPDGWRALRPFSNRISVPICLDLRWRDTNDDKIATYRRFATHQFLTKNRFERPSDMRSHFAEFPKAQLIYFLDNICVSSVLDMLPVFKGSQALDEEREKICAALVELDPKNADKYQDELLQITHRKVVQSGLQLVDSSRIYVDTDGIARWARRELAESFFRYRSLVDAGIGVSEKFDDLVRKLSKHEGFENYLVLPSSEADEILIRLVFDLEDHFLFDPSYGLDSFLSQRVRHGSIQNYLRSNVEQANLVTQKDSRSGDYEPNRYWMRKLHTLSQDDRVLLDDSFRSFSAAFDGLILELKDRYLNVRSKDKPDGLFHLRITTPLFYLLRSAAQHCENVDELTRVSIQIFWAALSPSLVDTEKFLSENIKQQVALIFEQLRAKLVIAVQDPNFAALSTAIGDASAKVQAELDRMAGWLHRLEGSGTPTTFTLKQAFDIAIESAVSGFKPFSPIIHSNISSDLKVHANNLISISDVVRVALGNVHEHAKTKKPPNIWIETTIDEPNGMLTIAFTSDVRPGVRTLAAEDRLAAIRAQIADGSFAAKVRSEGGSGLLKVANLVSRADKGSLDFDFVGNDKFEIKIKLPFVEAEHRDT
jgi:hypothetical protein